MKVISQKNQRDIISISSKKVGWFLVAVFLIFSSTSGASSISVKLPNGLIANADFRKGEKDKPALLVLHGFMTTHNLNIVQTITNDMEENGFTVLAPTLTLNINNRKSGMSCEAIHTHTMENDIKEIRWWMSWMSEQGYNNIMAIGHSTGSLQLAITLSESPPVNVKKAILTAPAYLRGKPFSQHKEKEDLKIANEFKSENNSTLHKYHMSYCKGDFVSPYNVYLSYKYWSANRLLDTISKIKVPYTIIIASEDHRFGPYLNNRFKDLGLKIVSIDGANHFFSSPYEFDFIDAILNELN